MQLCKVNISIIAIQILGSIQRNLSSACELAADHAQCNIVNGDVGSHFALYKPGADMQDKYIQLRLLI